MIKITHSRHVVLVILLLTLLFLSGCSFVRIQNVAAGPATVSVITPDSGKASVRNIPSGAIVDIFSPHGGRYTVSMIASERYINTLEQLRSVIENKLFANRQTLTAEEVAWLVENLNQIDKLLEQTRLPGASCTGYLPDYETVVAVVSYDDFSGEWIVECGSGGSN